MLKWAYGVRDLSGPEKAVLCCLAWHLNSQTGLCCPSARLIADETCLGLSTVKRAIASLIAKGFFERRPRGRRAIYVPAITEPESPRESQIEAQAEPISNKKKFYKKKATGKAQYEKKIGQARHEMPVGIPSVLAEIAKKMVEGKSERELRTKYGETDIAKARKVVLGRWDPEALEAPRRVLTRA